MAIDPGHLQNIYDNLKQHTTKLTLTERVGPFQQD